jgi:5-methyltetrahydropteroyltriglutamate--homocysteine methyltransferase
VGRENVMGGTDCGLGPRVGHAKIAWAKLEALAEGARLATKRLWPRRPQKRKITNSRRKKP